MKPIYQIIRQHADKAGVLPFDRFMELSLYCPEYGYYEQQTDNIGQRGDFYTSVSTGPLFGELLAFQFAAWLEVIQINHSPVPVLSVTECGAHDGKLARDILTWLRCHRPRLFEAVEYRIEETSMRRQQWQRETLKDFANVRWQDSRMPTPDAQQSGIIFSNELLDAMPVRRFGWDAPGQTWFEWGVALEAQRFAWAKIQITKSNLPSALRDLPVALLSVLPDGYTIETSPVAENWWRGTAGRLIQGKLVAIDYGFTAEEMFSPARTRGTLRAYRHHQVTDDLLANPGEQDLTAHVNFSAIQTVGAAAGLKTEQFTSQAKFLTRILGGANQDPTFGPWTTARTRQFQTLTHPEHLGRAFRVLVQSK